jgi:hypothetical protein
MAFFWRRRVTPNADDSKADPAAVARILEWLPGLNTPLTWETPPAQYADAHTAAGEEDDRSAPRVANETGLIEPRAGQSVASGLGSGSPTRPAASRTRCG